MKLLKELEEKKDYKNPVYKEIEEVLGNWFTTRMVPKPNCWYDCFKTINEEIYTKM